MDVLIAFVAGVASGIVVTHYGYKNVLAELKSDLLAAESMLKRYVK